MSEDRFEDAEREARDAPAAEEAEAAEDEDPVAKLQEENETLRDRALRALAELENTRKRAERDGESARAYAIERFATDLLSVADNLQRAIASVPDEARESGSDNLKTLLSGVELTEKELMRAFERHGVRREDPAGEPFDPNRHQAVAQIPSDIPSGRVAEVMQTGYVLGERTLRAAMVAVSTGPGGPSSGGPQGGGAGGEDGGDRPAGGATDIKV